jgi:1-deoxy-D-xylulose-5-phosphate synthase
MIKSLNFDYSGPIDGHDIFAIIKELKQHKSKGPKFLHVITTKGLKQAEENQVKYHAPGKDAASGEILSKSEENLPQNTKTFWF